ncbi:MAG: metallophosphoesterase [Armatimonadota bacterium]|nr:metallophosphoesterase [Armatimonadota bacterium]
MASLGLAFILALALSAPLWAASYGFDQNRFKPGLMWIYFNNPAKSISLSFTLSPDMAEKRLAGARFYVEKMVGTSFPIIGELRRDVGGLPTGEILAQGSCAPAVSYSWNQINFASVSLQAGERYHLALHPAAGFGNASNYYIITYQLCDYLPDFGVCLNFGGGWFENRNADPTLILTFMDGSVIGNPYFNVLTEFQVYGSDANCKVGQRFVLSNPMTIRKISLCVTRSIALPTANLRVGIAEEATGNVLADEVFSTPQDTSSWNYNWTSHTFSSPIDLSANTPYKLYLTQEGGLGDSSHYYSLGSQKCGYSYINLGFGGDVSYTFTETASGIVTDSKLFDLYFLLETEGQHLVRLTPHLVTETSFIVLAESQSTSDAVIEYGTTTDYGASISSSGKTLHEFHIEGLAPGATYHYRVKLINPSDPSDFFITQDYTLKTNSDNQSVNVTVVGDTQGLDFNTTFRLASTFPHDLVLTVGDNTPLLEQPDEQKTYSRAMNEWRWFLSDITPLTTSAALYTTQGNHDDYFDPSRPYGLMSYQDSVIMPSNGSGDERYFSFDYGPAHFVVLDSMEWNGNSYWSVGPTQLAWLEADLRASTKPWKIVLTHILINGVSVDDRGWCISNWQQVHNLLRDTGVDLVLQGHRHVYNRYFKNGICYVTNTTPTLLGNWFTGDGYEQGSTAIPVEPNFGGDPGTIPAYVARPGWVQLSISETEIHVAHIDQFGRTLDAFQLPFTPPLPVTKSLGEVKKSPVGSYLTCSGVVSSASSDSLNRVYVEDVKRSAGIWVICEPPVDLERGRLVEATGMLNIDITGEQVLNCATVTKGGLTDDPRPLGVKISAIGGETINGVPGILGMRGVNNTGLLIRIIGMVTSVSETNSRFYVYDGSKVWADNGSIGVLVVAPAGVDLPSSGDMVIVTGISSCDYSGSVLCRVLRIRDQTDIDKLY